MYALAAAFGMLALVGGVVWYASRLGRKLGETEVQLNAVRDLNRRTAEAIEADANVRRDIAAAGVYAPDENQRD